MNDASKATVHKTSAISAALGALLSPIPLVDELLLLPIYGVMATRIGRHNGLAMNAIPWRPIWTTTLNGLLARGIANLTVAYIPGVAAVANAASAVLLTEFLGRYMDDACADPASAESIGVKAIVEMIRNKNANGVPHEAR